MKRALRKISLVVLTVLLVGSAIYAWEVSIFSATRALKNTNGVGSPRLNPSVVARQTWAYSQIMQSRDPAQIFHQVFSDAGPAGKIYALGALSLLDPPFFKEHRQDLPSKTDKPIEVIFNCLGYESDNPQLVLNAWMARGYHVTCNTIPKPSRYLTVPFGDAPTIFERVVPNRIRWLLFDRWQVRLEDRYQAFVGDGTVGDNLAAPTASNSPACLEAVFFLNAETAAQALVNTLAQGTGMIYLDPPLISAPPVALQSGGWEVTARTPAIVDSDDDLIDWARGLSSIAFDFHTELPELRVVTEGCPNIEPEQMPFVER